MNAIKPDLPQVPPVSSPRSAARRRSQRHPYRAIAVETTAKLTVNLVLSAAAIGGLAQLIPYNFSQQAKLAEIQTEVKIAEKRVNRLRNDFSRYFDPQQGKSIMQEQSHRSDPNQRQVIWVDKGATNDE